MRFGFGKIHDCTRPNVFVNTEASHLVHRCNLPITGYTQNFQTAVKGGSPLKIGITPDEKTKLRTTKWHKPATISSTSDPINKLGPSFYILCKWCADKSAAELYDIYCVSGLPIKWRKI